MSNNLAHVIGNPFECRSKEYQWESGASVLDVLNLIDSDLANNSIVCINGHRLERQYYHVIHPKEGMLITVNVVPADKEIFRSIAFIGLAVVSAVAGQYYATAYFGGSAFAAAAIGAGIYAVGAIAINALLPVQTGTFDTEGITRSQSLSIGAARNRITPFAPLPVLLGKMKMFPPMAALPYTSDVGGEQASVMLLYLGTGDICVDKTTAKLGETLLSSYSGVTVQYDTGCVDDVINVYKNTVYEEAVNVAVAHGVENEIIRTTQSDAEQAAVELKWLRGLIDYGDKGGTRLSHVDIKIRYRLEGSSTWITAHDFRVRAETTDVITETKKIIFSTAGSYQVSVYSTYSSLKYDQEAWFSDGSLYDGDQTPEPGVAFQTPTWTVLRSIQNAPPVNKIPQSCAGESPIDGALIGLQIEATDQLSGVPDTFNVIGQSKAPDWTGSAWVEAATSGTSNPASILRYLILKNCRANARPLADARLDNDSFTAFYDWCETMSFEFNLYIDFQSTVQETINMCAAAGRAICYPVDGLWIVKIDKKQTAAHQWLSPRNTISFNVSKAYPDELHAFRCRFISEEDDWNNSEIIVYKDTYDETNSTQFEALELPGVTNPDQIWYLARYFLNVSIIQRETFTIELDIENLVSLPGDRIEYQEDCLEIGLGAARVLSFSDPTMVLDTEMEYSGGSYGFTIRHSDGTAETVTATAVGGSPTDTWTLASSPSVVAGDLAIFGEVGSITQSLIIKDIKPGADMTATLTCLAYDDALYPEENGDTTPGYTPYYTGGTVSLPVPAIQSATSGANGTTITVSWVASGDDPDFSLIDHALFSYRKALVDENGEYVSSNNPAQWTSVSLPPHVYTHTFPAEEGVLYEYQVRFIYISGVYSSEADGTIRAGSFGTIYTFTNSLTLTTNTFHLLPMTTTTATLSLETYAASIS